MKKTWNVIPEGPYAAECVISGPSVEVDREAKRFEAALKDLGMEDNYGRQNPNTETARFLFAGPVIRRLLQFIPDPDKTRLTKELDDRNAGKLTPRQEPKPTDKVTAVPEDDIPDPEIPDETLPTAARLLQRLLADAAEHFYEIDHGRGKPLPPTRRWEGRLHNPKHPGFARNIGGGEGDTEKWEFTFSLPDDEAVVNVTAMFNQLPGLLEEIGFSTGDGGEHPCTVTASRPVQDKARAGKTAFVAEMEVADGTGRALLQIEFNKSDRNLWADFLENEGRLKEGRLVDPVDRIHTLIEEQQALLETDPESALSVENLVREASNLVADTTARTATAIGITKTVLERVLEQPDYKIPARSLASMAANMGGGRHGLTLLHLSDLEIRSVAEIIDEEATQTPPDFCRLLKNLRATLCYKPASRGKPSSHPMRWQEAFADRHKVLRLSEQKLSEVLSAGQMLITNVEMGFDPLTGEPRTRFLELFGIAGKALEKFESIESQHQLIQPGQEAWDIEDAGGEKGQKRGKS